MTQTAMITGVTGQDGSYLAEFLLEKGYRIIGLKRRTSLINTSRIDHLFENPKFRLVYWDLDDVGELYKLLYKHEPNEFYHLAAQSHVKISFDMSESTVNGIVMGTLRILNALNEAQPSCRFYQASSSEMFGANPEPPFNEESKLQPVSPYACAKVCAHHLVGDYRRAYGMHASSGILFNHESERRGETFVTRKITMGAARIVLGQQEKLFLGNRDAVRDWGHAKDYVRAMWYMTQQETPDDYVIATGKTCTVQRFLECVFNEAGLSIDDHVKTDPRLFRPNEVPFLQGDSTKAREVLGWKPTIGIEELATMMYQSDLELCRKSQ